MRLGDLDALRKNMEFVCMGIMAGTEPYNAPLTEIDNAPTVEERSYEQGVIDGRDTEFDNGFEQGYAKGYENCEHDNERPQGEWIAREDMDYLDENKVVHNHFQCKKCGLIHDFIDGHTSQYNFCPNCGADMRGAEE